MSYSFTGATADNLSKMLFPALSEFATFTPIISLNFKDLIWGVIIGVAVLAALSIKRKNAKKYRSGEEYGSARWGNAKDIAPFIDNNAFENNVILTQSEMISMGKLAPEYQRNKNILVIGGSGTGKTRFFVKPNLMQMHSSYVVTDPKGTVLVECGKMLQKGRVKKKNGKIVKDKSGNTVYEPYKIKVFNTIDFNKSMHYNPFAYIRPETREQDILKFVETLITNTTSQQQHGGDEFWTKAEKLLYTSYIALIITCCPEEEWNFETLIELINDSECREDDESFKNAVDWAFFYLEKWLDGNWTNSERAGCELDENGNFVVDKNGNRISAFLPENECYKNMIDNEPAEWQISLGRFAIRQYKSYKLAAGKTAKSILISCSTRLGPFSIDKVLEVTRYDELQLDSLGDELTALFVIISDTDATFNFLVAIMYSQLFNLLCTKADNNPNGKGKLDIPVRFLLDEFANIGQIPNFDKLIATIRSRDISASIILQAKSQLKSAYRDNADTIEGNCDSTLFLGGTEKTTIKDLSENLGKETIDLFNESKSKGQSESYGQNFQKTGRELKSHDELKVMSNKKCILEIRGLRPFFSNKFDIENHPQYKRLFDYNDKNFFDIKKFVRKERERFEIQRKREKMKKAKMQPNDEVDYYDYGQIY